MDNVELQKIVRSVVEEIAKELNSKNIINSNVILPAKPVIVSETATDLYEINLPKKGRAVVTEKDINEAIKLGKDIGVPADVIITPLAYEVAQRNRIKIVKTNIQNVRTKKLIKVAIGSDHGGFKLKEDIKDYLYTINIPYTDVGTYSEKSCDYPDYALAVAKEIAEGRADRGIVIDGAGIGSTITANKVKGILAGCVHNRFTLLTARKHDNINVMALGSNVLKPAEARELVRLFLNVEFEGGRHQRRIDKIIAIENSNLG